MADNGRGQVTAASLSELRTGEAATRWRAAASLTSSHTREAAEALARALHDPEPFVRWAAAQSLGEIASHATDPGITATASQIVLATSLAPQAGARAAAADAIAAWGSRGPLEPALSLARDADATVRAAAIRALGLAGSGAPQVVTPFLRQALEDRDPEVRRMAANAIAWCRDDASALALRARLRDPVGIVRAAAIRALARLSSGDPELAILPLLKDTDPAVRAEAVRYLRQRGSVAALEALAGLEGDTACVGEATVGALVQDACSSIQKRQGLRGRLGLGGRVRSD